MVEASDGAEGVRAFYEARPDVVVMDLTMPEMDGWALLERIREVSEVPILVISGLATEAEKVRALQGGADDYMTKPSGPQELQARVASLLRRGRPRQDAETPHDDGVLRIDPRRMEAWLLGRRLELTPKEFRLFSVFSRHPGQTLSAEQLAELTWGDPLAAGDRVKVLISRLRRKCEQTAGEFPVRTVRGFGYRYQPTTINSDEVSSVQ